MNSKKTVLIDMPHLDGMMGFGEIERNYIVRLVRMDIPDMRFVLAVPRSRMGAYGDGVDYIDCRALRRESAAYPHHIDLWHATTQQYKYRRRSAGTLQLLTIHDLNYLVEKRGLHLLKHKVRMHFAVKHSDRLTVISEYVRRDVEAHLPVGDRPLDVIYNGIADVERGEQRRPSFAAGGVPFFFTIGQIRKKKNFAALVPMMRHFPDHRLYICGDDHFDYAAEVRAAIPAADADRILVTGKITDAEKCWLYAHADAFLFPSLVEGFGIPVLEAMRFGCRVVTTRYTSLPEVCGPHAAYFEQFTPTSMAAVVKAAVDGWSRDGAEAEAARQHSLTFSYDNYVRRYVALYREMLGLPALDNLQIRR